MIEMEWRLKAEKIIDILLADENISRKELDGIAMWLITDDERAEEKAEIFVRKFSEMLRRGENRDDARRLWPALAERLDISIVSKATAHKPFYRRAAFRIAAVIIPLAVFTAGAFMFLYDRNDNLRKPVMKTLTVTDSMTTQQGHKSYILPDNSTIRLYEHSLLRYAENFEEGRHVELEGKAHFNITKAADEFQVRADEMKISVLGTMFKVDSHACEIDLFYGKVSVEAAGNHIVMNPGQHLRYDRSTRRMEVINIPLRARAYDEMPGLVFENMLLSDVLAKMGHDYGVRFRIEDNTALKEQEIWGDFTNFGSIEEFMTMLQKISGRFTYEITSDEVVIKGI